MKIIQLFNRYLLPGGEEKSVTRIAADLEAGGHRVVRFWKASAEWQNSGAPSRLRQPFLMWRNGPVLEELRGLQERERGDVWLLHNIVPVISLGVYRLARRLRVPVIQWLHNYRPISPGGALYAGKTPLRPEDRWVAWKETLAGSWNGIVLTAWLSMGYAFIKWRGDFEAVKAWVAVSNEMKQVFARAGWFPQRLHTIRHSWHIQPRGVGEADEGHFVFLGRMVEPKGVRFLVDLWRRPELKDRRLIMAGQGPLADELRPVSPPNVQWVGHIEGEEKRRWLGSCRAVLFPCLWAEPLSTVAYEAYEVGKPILASDLGGMKEIVFDGKTGRLLAPGDPQAWLRAILELNAPAARELGRNGRTWLETHATPQAWNAEFEAIASRVTGASGRADK